MKKEEIESYPLVLTAKEISSILKISKPNAYEVMKRIDFLLIKIGRCKGVLRDKVFRWLMSQQ
ncbi:DNA-binding protein [Paenisporosarcina sp. FSL H8-0542]|uniref:DNA-binding protein n=1 Tax=Paenisporosarcina sp. FSL H8-0542 TaxID=2921401 RepID=UPI00315A81C1